MDAFLIGFFRMYQKHLRLYRLAIGTPGYQHRAVVRGPSPTKIVVQASAFAQNIVLITAAEARNFIFIVTP